MKIGNSPCTGTIPVKFKKLSDDTLTGHSFGNKRCKNCSEGFPQSCQCGGLYHADIQQAEGNGYI